MKDYLENRLKDQKEWYRRSANANKKMFFNYQTVIIFLGAIIPIIVVLENAFGPLMMKWGSIATAIIAATISIYAGLDKLKQPQPNWFNYRANEEMIKKEEWCYKYKVGVYSGLSDDEANKLLVERVESIISADIARTTNIEAKEKPAPGGKGTDTPDPKEEPEKPDEVPPEDPVT